MENYQDIISRLGQYLSEIDSDIKSPLSVVANKYRIIAEAVCKAIIVGHGAQPIGALEKLIADASKHVEADENSRDAGMFKTEIKYLQSVGNTYSHDGFGSKISETEGQTAAFDALVKVLRIAFFGESDLDAPPLPKSMEERIPARTLGRAKFENPRAEEVVRLCFPKHRVETKIKRTDHANRLVYDYVTVDLGGGLFKGMMFIRSRTAIEKTLNEFNTSIGSVFPDSLEIITPRAYRPDGGEIDRRKSINDLVKNTSFDSKGRKVHVKYFDDFVWESCLPQAFRDDISPIEKNSYFIKQSLDLISEIDAPLGAPLSAEEYVKTVLNKPHEHSPVHVVIGPAGIGKTTFCDDIAAYINDHERKRVILLSATDFRETSNSTVIESVSDLYKLAVANGLMDDAYSLESHNFEINLACGNFILLIDGFDELESHLGTSLNFDKFMHSLSELEDCFRKVLVILTVRDYDIERFRRIKQTSICRLRGFSGQDTDRYLRERLPKESISEANTLLRSFNVAGEPEKHTTIPLYASLICDYLLEAQSSSAISSVHAQDTAKFFASAKPLDALVKKIVDREIAKQSLGKIGPDDFFDILIEIIRAPQHTVTEAALIGYIKACDSDAQNINSANFLRNPFLRWEGKAISFKYDSLTYFFKSRLLARKIKEGQFSQSPSIEFMAEFHSGEGPLYDEVESVLPSADHRTSPATVRWFQELIKYGHKEPESKLPWRKAMSAFLYWALNPEVDKADRTASLNAYFGGRLWTYFSIYGRFYPLSFIGINIENGYIENFSSLQSCDYAPERAVFSSSTIIFDEKSQPEKLERSLFGEGCIFSPNLSIAFNAKEMADESGYEVIRDNLYKILKVGFRSNRFLWKSKGVYKNVTVIGKFSLASYLGLLTKEGVLSLELSHNGSEQGYVVSDSWREDARKLVEEKNPTQRMNNIISSLPDRIH